MCHKRKLPGLIKFRNTTKQNKKKLQNRTIHSKKKVSNVTSGSKLLF